MVNAPEKIQEPNYDINAWKPIDQSNQTSPFTMNRESMVLTPIAARNTQAESFSQNVQQMLAQ